MNLRVVAVVAACVMSLASVAAGTGAGQDGWVEVRSTHFIVVSDAGEERARRIATLLETIRDVFQQALPGVTPSRVRPLRVFAMRNVASMQELLPPYRDVDRRSMPVGLFLRGQDENHIVLVEDADTENPYEVVFHEYFHSLALPLIPSAPLWFHEGIAGFWENTRIYDDRIETGLPSGQYVAILENERPMPLEELLSADAALTASLSEHRTSIFYAQSWALMHYILLGDRRDELRPQLTPYLTEVRDGVPSVEAFERAFGDVDDIENKLRQYLNRFRFQALQVEKPQGIADSDHTAVAITADQQHALRGSFWVHIGAFEDAGDEIGRALDLNPDNARALEALGMLQLRNGAHAEAAASFERAASLNGTLYLPRYYLAVIESSNITDRESLLSVKDNLERAVRLNPGHAASLARLSSMYVALGEEIELALTLAEQAVGVRPDDVNALLALGVAAKANGEVAEARDALERATRLAPDFVTAQDQLAEVLRIEKYPFSGAWVFGDYALWIRIGVDDAAVRCRGTNAGMVREKGVLDGATITWSVVAGDGTTTEIDEEISLDGGSLELRTASGDFKMRRIPALPAACDNAGP